MEAGRSSSSKRGNGGPDLAAFDHRPAQTAATGSVLIRDPAIGSRRHFLLQRDLAVGTPA